MFSTFFENRSLKLQNRALAEAAEASEKKAASWEAMYKTLNGSVNSQLYHCDVAVDWKAMNAFSVERCISKNDGRPYTNIGCVFGGQVREWTLYCSPDHHNDLVEEFNEYLKTKTYKEEKNVGVTVGAGGAFVANNG